MHFAVSSLRGKLGGLYACGATFRYTVPLPKIFLTRLFSKLRLKRKDFQEILRLPWAQEVPSSNLGAPTTNLLKHTTHRRRGHHRGDENAIWLTSSHVVSFRLASVTLRNKARKRYRRTSRK